MFDKQTYSKEYYERNKDKLQAYQKQYRNKNKKHLLARSKSWRDANKDRVKDLNLQWWYGISIEDYNILFQKQEGKCAICGRHQSMFEKALHVDHNHTTNQVRGLLCSDCNFGLGKFKDNRDLLLSGSLYLGQFDDQNNYER